MNSNKNNMNTYKVNNKVNNNMNKVLQQIKSINYSNKSIGYSIGSNNMEEYRTTIIVNNNIYEYVKIVDKQPDETSIMYYSLDYTKQIQSNWPDDEVSRSKYGIDREYYGE